MTSTGSRSAPATCLGCGCTCDDIHLSIDGGRIAAAANACPLGAAWFGDGSVPGRTRVDGRDVPLPDTLAAAATLLGGAARPLIYLAPDISCETQREAIAVADLLHAVADSVTSSTVMPAMLASQERGRAGATLGEVRHRADVLVFWGVDPAARYPRYWTRYAPDVAGIHVPGGRRARRVIAVDVAESRGPADADVRISVRVDDEVAVLTFMAALAHGDRDVPAEATVGDAADSARQLRAAIGDGRYVVVVADTEPDDAAASRDPGRAAALLRLAQALNGPTRAALSSLRAGGNRSGADACLTSQTGYPAAVDFSRGFPRYRPHDGAEPRLERGEVDAALLVGNAGLVPARVIERMRAVPHAAIGPRVSDSLLAGGRAVVDTGIAGIHEAGTALRMDDVPLPLAARLAGPPSARDVVAALRTRLRSARAPAAAASGQVPQP